MPIIDTFTFLNLSSQTTRSSRLNLMIKPLCRIKTLQRFPQYRLPDIYNNALTNYPIKIDGEMKTLISAYKNLRFQEYEQFKCEKKNCYSCQP